MQKSHRNPSVLLLNAQGFIKNKEEIVKLINEKKPKIMCLTETHITEDIGEFEIAIENYRVVRTNTENNRTGGVLTYIYQGIEFKVLNTKNVENNFWINTVQLMGKYEGTVICNVYHSPSESDGRFIELIVSECEELTEKGIVILMGDFNIDVMKETQYTKRLIRNLLSVGLKQYIRNPTRITDTSQTTIDLVFSNFYVQTEVLLTPKITDHSIIRIDLLNDDDSDNELITWCKRDFSNFTEQEFHDILKDEFTRYYEMENDDNNESSKNKINTFANKVIECITKTINKTAPVIKKVRSLRWVDKPWITDEVRNASKTRDKAYKKAVNTNIKADWEDYRVQRNRVVAVIRDKKRQYYEQNIDNQKGNPQKMWRALKELIGNKRSIKGNKGIVFDGIQYNEKEQIAQKFNHFFLESIENIVKDIGVDDEVEHFEQQGNSELEYFREIMYDELDKIIKELDKKKGSKDEISVETYKLVWEKNSNVILDLMNRIMQTGVVPDEWKNSVIIPTPKVSGTNKADEYRPINTLKIYEKVCELAVKKQLLEYINANNILIEEQSGFRKGHSCETALQDTLMEWRGMLDKSEIIGVVFIDFSRAFETIDRNIMINKLNMYGIKGKVLEWFKSYLQNRTQQVLYEDVLSSKMIVKYGVPQGSVLGPILFILYINDVIKQLEMDGCKCKLFADDMIIYVHSDDVIDIEEKLNRNLVKIVKWMKRNSVKINSKKTVFMPIHDPRKLDVRGRCNIKVGDSIIREVRETKYLGVVVDDNLLFESHAWYIGKKVAKKTSFLNRIKKWLSQYSRVTMYRTIIGPHYDYCSTVMINCSEHCMGMLQRTQNRAMRAILMVNRYTPIRTMLQVLGFMSVKQRVHYNVCMLIYKMKNGLSPGYLSEEVRLVSDRHRYETRSRNDIDIAATRTKTAEKSLSYMGFQMFNDLPKKLKEEERLERFKRGLIEHVKEKV